MCNFFGFYGFAKSDLYEMAFKGANAASIATRDSNTVSGVVSGPLGAWRRGRGWASEFLAERTLPKYAT